MHSIKGACGFLAYPKLEGVASAGEGLLCRLREGEIDWRPEITSALLSLSDAMRRILGQIEKSGTEGDEKYIQLTELLTGLQNGAKGPAGQVEPSPRACTNRPESSPRRALKPRSPVPGLRPPNRPLRSRGSLKTIMIGPTGRRRGASPAAASASTLACSTSS